MTRPGDRNPGPDGGFTLIELIVVIAVLGILAAIAIPAYQGQQRSARDASVVADVRNTSTLVTNWVLENGRTAITNTADYVSSGGRVVQSGSTTINVTTSGTGAYTVCGYTSGGGTYSSNSSAFLIDSAASTAGRTTTGCPGNGVPATSSSTPSPSASTATGSGGAASGGTTSGGGAGATPSATASSTPTPTASASSTPTPTPTPTPTNWVDCAQENGTCSFTGTHLVRYGLAPSSYVVKTLTNGTPCTNDVFGDPAYGYGKTCSYVP